MWCCSGLESMVSLRLNCFVYKPHKHIVQTIWPLFSAQATLPPMQAVSVAIGMHWLKAYYVQLIVALFSSMVRAQKKGQSVLRQANYVNELSVRIDRWQWQPCPLQLSTATFYRLPTMFAQTDHSCPDTQRSANVACSPVGEQLRRRRMHSRPP